MSEPNTIELSYTPNRPLYAAAMAACARSYPFWPNRFMAFIFTVFVGIGVATGGALIAALFLRGLGMWETNREFVAAAPVVAMLIYFVALRFLNAANLRVLLNAKAVTLPTTATLSPEGVCIRSNATCWDLNWTGIDDVLSFKLGFGFRFGNLIFPIPDSAIPVGQTKAETLTRLRGWLEQYG